MKTAATLRKLRFWDDKLKWKSDILRGKTFQNSIVTDEIHGILGRKPDKMSIFKSSTRISLKEQFVLEE